MLQRVWSRCSSCMQLQDGWLPQTASAGCSAELVAGSEGRQEPLLTVEQLQYCCCFLALDSAMLAKQPSAEQLAVLKAAAAISAQTMRQLEPNNPKSHFKATSALVYEATVRDFKQAVQGFLRAFELSRQQRSDFWSVQSAVNALSFATTRPSEVGHSALAAAVAAFEQTAEAALRRCKRLLPEVWVRVLVVDVERARPLLPGAHEQLQLWQQQASSRRCASSAASQASGSAQRAAARQQPDRTRRDLDARHITDCDSCGQPAVGLRRCGRCKKAQYCRCCWGCCFQCCCLCCHADSTHCDSGTAGWVLGPA